MDSLTANKIVLAQSKNKKIDEVPPAWFRGCFSILFWGIVALASIGFATIFIIAMNSIIDSCL